MDMNLARSLEGKPINDRRSSRTERERTLSMQEAQGVMGGPRRRKKGELRDVYAENFNMVKALLGENLLMQNSQKSVTTIIKFYGANEKIHVRGRGVVMDS